MPDDNVVEWPGPLGSRDGGLSSADTRPPTWLQLDAALRDAPNQIRGPLRTLAALLASREPIDASWRADLSLKDAFSTVGRLRQLITVARHAPSAEIAASHARLDLALAAVADDELRRARQTQKRMLEGVSHDIRSPLNSILFLADALRAEQAGELNPVQARQVGVLYTAAVTLVKMVNDLIDFSRLGREHILVASTSFSVESVIVDLEGLLGPLMAHRQAQLRTELQAEGLRSGDPQLLSRVLLNLVSNALEAVDEGGHVTVQVSEAEGGDLRVEVSDDRAGTDLEMLRSLLSVPESESPGRTLGWTRGLGLAISAQLVQAAGGRISVDSLAGEGTVFRVDLPFPRL
jgi:signal transduction histidine kinase